MALFELYWFAGVFYLIWLGRLAYGLRRSIVYYGGGAMLAGGVIFLFAHIIAYSNMSARVKKTYATTTAGSAL